MEAADRCESLKRLIIDDELDCCSGWFALSDCISKLLLPSLWFLLLWCCIDFEFWFLTIKQLLISCSSIKSASPLDDADDDYWSKLLISLFFFIKASVGISSILGTELAWLEKLFRLWKESTLPLIMRAWGASPSTRHSDKSVLSGEGEAPQFSSTIGELSP